MNELLNPTIFFLSVATSMASWAVIIWMLKPKWEQNGESGYLKGLISIHLFRFIGLVALVPNIFDPQPFGWTQTYLMQIGFGDWIANVLAIVSIVAISKNWRSKMIWVWAFIILGTLDTIFAGGTIIPSINDQNKINTMGWLIIVVYVPALIVTELLILKELLFKKSTKQTS